VSCPGRRSLREAKKCPVQVAAACGKQKYRLAGFPQLAAIKTVIESFKNDKKYITTLKVLEYFVCQ
jgi:hypothetical protein